MMMKGVLFSVLSLNCVAASLLYQTNLMQISGKLKITENTCFTVERKLECAVACCTGGKCKWFYYAEPGLCQCKQDVTESRIASEEGPFELWTNPETVQEETTKTATTTTSNTNRHETHYFICSQYVLYWYQYGKSRHIAKKQLEQYIMANEVDYVHSTNTLYFILQEFEGVGYFVTSIGKIGPVKVMLKGHQVRHFKLDEDKDFIIWATKTTSKSATLKGKNIKTIYSRGLNIAFLHIDKFNSHVYIAEDAGGVYVTNYIGGNPRILVELRVSSLFYDHEDKILYMTPWSKWRLEENQQNTEYKILRQVPTRDYFVVHRGTIYYRPEVGKGLGVMTLDGKRLPDIALDTHGDVSVIFL